MNGPAATRIIALDVVRGVAVMGILLLNIIDFAMPGYAYVDPHFYGGATGLNLAIWRIVYVLADGKMRGLFTILFGASLLLIADRAEQSGRAAWRVHYARMAVLALIGLAHAYLIWAGDILVLYAVCGAIVFPARRLRARALLAVAAALLAWKLAGGLLDYQAARQFETRAHAPNASVALKAEWRAYAAQLAPEPDEAARELAAYRGSYADALPMRAETVSFVHRVADPQSFPDTVALMLLGMALLRTGFFAARWPRRAYAGLCVGGATAIALYWPLAASIERSGFSPITLTLTEAVHLTLLRPILCLGYAAALILWIASGSLPGVQARVAATGRMAFSNYLGTSIVCTLLFNGYGLGWYGHLERWQCYPVVASIWLAMLAWSKPWLERHAHGPFEWLWRSLAGLLSEKKTIES